MKVEYNNLDTHFVFSMLNQPENHKKETFADDYEQFIKHYHETLQKNKVIR